MKPVICYWIFKDFTEFLNRRKHDAPMNILRVNKVTEQVGEHQFIYSYLVHAQAKIPIEPEKYMKIHVSVFDRETNERGEGSLFWKLTGYMQHPNDIASNL